MQENQQFHVKNTNRPEWLENLERESWQPELLISGLAIFATMQFPALIADFQHYVAFNFDADILMYAAILTTYLSIASYAIAVNFSIHFVLRVFWIGVLGLISVYPKGIDYDNYPYGGKKFVEKLRQKITNLEDFSLQIDRLCSIIFSLSGLIVLSLVSVCILVSSIFLLSLLVKFLLPSYYDGRYNQITFIILGVVISLFGVLISLFNYTKLKHTTFADKYHFFIYWTFSGLVFNVLNRPFHYLSMTFSTNASVGKMNVFIGVYISLLTLFILLNAKLQYEGIETRLYYAEESNEFALNPMYYDSLRPKHRYATQPCIPSDVMEGKFVKLFIPYVKRLDAKLEEVCKNSSLNKEESISSFQYGQLQNKAYLQCFETFYQVYLNNEKYTDIEWQFYQHPNKGEQGIISYILTDSLQVGKNVFRIEERKREGKEEKKVFEIPFWLGR
ncbi:MAG: hypothetical protein R3E32_04225 [Chitinophagales bacterium]